MGGPDFSKRPVARGKAQEKALNPRTLTRLCNARLQWLIVAQAALDATFAVGLELDANVSERYALGEPLELFSGL